MSEYDPTKANNFLEAAKKVAGQSRHDIVTLEHLLTSLLMNNKEVVTILKHINCNAQGVLNDLKLFFNTDIIPQGTGQKPKVSVLLSEMFIYLTDQAVAKKQTTINEADVLLAMVNVEDSHASYYLRKNGFDTSNLKHFIENGPVSAGEKGNMTKEKALEILEEFCVNLNNRARRGGIDPLIGRESEVYDLVKNTARRTKNNSIIIGEPGIGKTAIVEGLAKLIVEERVPEILSNSVVYSLDIGNLIAGTKYRGEMEERLKNILNALTFIESPILFIDEIHTVIGAGAGGGQGPDVGNMLKPALARGKLRCIGSTTNEEFRKTFETDKALLRRFQKLEVFEPSIEDTKRILQGLKHVYEEHHGVTYTDEAINTAVELSARYITNRQLPDKAIDILDGSGATQRVAPLAFKQTLITAELVEDEISKVAKIPAKTVKEDDTSKLANLETDLRASVFGQDQAIDVLVDNVIMARAGLREANKTLGSYLFVGPTGVGKTEITKQLAKTLSVPLLRYDMSEYMEAHSVSKLIGSPPGYVGYGDGSVGSGKLVNDIETNPYAILLLDEFEKAHRDVANLFLQVMDNGTLTSSNGKLVKFENVILIITSNIGAAAEAKTSIGFNSSERSTEGKQAMENHFAPEFRNRLDAIVKFNRLTKDNMLQVVDKFVNNLRGLAVDKKIDITLTDAAKGWLADKGYDPAMGARPLTRVIDTNIKKPLAREILFGELKSGGNVTIDLSGDGLTFSYNKKKSKKKELVAG